MTRQESPGIGSAGRSSAEDGRRSAPATPSVGEFLADRARGCSEIATPGGSRLVIADPPYLGRATRWYGQQGRGHGGGRGRADQHPHAHAWDDQAAHLALVEWLEEHADGWAIAATPSSLPVYLQAAPADVRVAVWVRGNAVPSGSRVRSVWEAVLVKIPGTRAGHGSGPRSEDVLTRGIGAGGFAGRKPVAWTHWILDMLGYTPGVDVVLDLFHGTGAVAAAADTYQPHTTVRERATPPAQAQQLRRTARAADGRRAAVLAALRAGGSVRAVAREAKVSTNTVYRWARDAKTTTQP